MSGEEQYCMKRPPACFQHGFCNPVSTYIQSHPFSELWANIALRARDTTRRQMWPSHQGIYLPMRSPEGRPGRAGEPNLVLISHTVRGHGGVHHDWQAVSLVNWKSQGASTGKR